MSAALDLLLTKEFPHGTRARYVAGRCRCDACRGANAQYQRDRAHRAKQVAEEAARERPRADAGELMRRWTAPCGAVQMRTFRRACPGIHGRRCPTRSYLRKDSTGDVCGGCRERLAGNPTVSAERARAHLLELAAAGVGRRAVSDASDVPASTIAQVRSGARPRIRLETERRLLDVDIGAIGDSATVDAEATWKLLDELLALGVPKTYIAARLGQVHDQPALQLRRERVLAKTALKVARVARELATELASSSAPKTFAIVWPAGIVEPRPFSWRTYDFLRRAAHAGAEAP